MDVCVILCCQMLWHLKHIRMITALYVSSVDLLLTHYARNLEWWAVTQRTSQNSKLEGGHLCRDGRSPGDTTVSIIKQTLHFYCVGYQVYYYLRNGNTPSVVIKLDIQHSSTQHWNDLVGYLHSFKFSLMIILYTQSRITTKVNSIITHDGLECVAS